MENKRYVALFDFDFGGYVILDFIRLLIEKKVMDEKFEKEIQHVLNQYSEKEMTYTEFANKIVQIYRKRYLWGTNTSI